MAEESGGNDKGIHKIIPAKGDSPAKRRQKIVVLGTIILVVLTLFIVMGRGSSSASTDTTPSTDTGGGDPLTNDASGFTPSASSGDSGDYGAQLAGEIGSIPNQVASMLNTQTQRRLRHAQSQLALRRRRQHHLNQEVKKEHRQIHTLRHQLKVAEAPKHHKPIHHKGKKSGT